MAITAPAAKTALVAALQAAHGDDVLVKRGLPAAVPKQRQRVYITSVNEYRRQGADQVRLEAYVIVVVVEAQPLNAPRNDEGQQAEAEMWALAQSVADVLDADPELGGSIWEAVFDGADELITAPIDDGWVANARVRVAVQARVER